jgi:two-component system, cell cycle response regulator DivK
MSKTTVLVVEDNADLRLICKAYLEHRGYEAICAANGREGVELARRRRPAAILTDLAMPVMDGWEVARQIHSDADTRNIPIVAITAMPISREDQERAGFAAYLRKPVDPETLVATLRAAVGEPVAA